MIHKKITGNDNKYNKGNITDLMQGNTNLETLSLNIGLRYKCKYRIAPREKTHRPIKEPVDTKYE